MKRFHLAAVTFFITVAKFAHADTNCGSWSELPCKIHVNCTVNGVADSINTQVLENTIKSHHDCYENFNNYYNRYEKSIKLFSSTEIILNINYNLDEFWKTNIFDSNIKTVTFKTIKTVPKKIKQFMNLKEIAFVDSSIYTFDLNSFLGLSSLFRINASSNLITYLTSHIDSNNANGYAQIIDLSRNKIDELPNQCFSRFPDLKSLNLSHNYIKNIEILSFEGISKLDVLDLSFNALTEIDQSLARFVNLQELYINNNNLYSISELQLRTLTKLEKLHLNNNKLRSIGEAAFKSLTKLEDLDLSNNYLEILKFETSALKNLLNFKARKNNITALPKFMFNDFVSLQKLDISDNKITRLEPQMFLYTNKLKYLDLSNNMIQNTVTANNFEGLSDIVQIKFSHNKFTSIENDAFNGSNNLVTVDFSHCNIESLGYNAFKNTGSIHTIDLSYNRINNFSLIPESVTLVGELFINNNRIKHFSEETFASLPNLENFTIANNNLLNETIVLTSSNILSYVDISNTNIDVQKFLENVNTLSKLSIANINKTFSFEHIVNKTICNLDLSYSGIENINKVFVYNVQNLTRLELRSNKLTFIDKFSFQYMPALTWLDLSCNLLSQIQPGSFMLSNNIVHLNLHGNSLEVLKFGMFEGLQKLLTLNLSDNMIREFSVNFLHSTPMLLNVALDNNRIKDINFRSFIKSNVSVISIGGNPLSCHTLANFKQYYSMYNSAIAKELIKNISITAETLDYHNDNYHGIRCVSGFDSSDNETWPELSTDTNSTSMLTGISKELKHFRNALEMALKRSDDKRISEKDTIENRNITNLLQSIDNDVNKNTNSLENLAKNITNIMNNNTDRLLESLKGYIKNMDAIGKTDTLQKYVNMTDTQFVKMSLLDQHLNEKLKIMNNEKERLVKELQTIFEDLKISPKIKTEAQTYDNGPQTNDLKGILYFVAVCLTIIIIMFIFTIAYKIFRESNILNRNRVLNSCSQPIANEMELS